MLPLSDMALAPLRALARTTLDARVTLFVGTETHGPGGRPVVVWTAQHPQPGKLMPATQGGQNIQADQPTPAGELVLALAEGAVIEAGQRAIVEGQDRLGVPWTYAVLVKRVVAPSRHEVTRRAYVTEIVGWPA